MDLIKTKVNLETVDEKAKYLNDKLDELLRCYIELKKNKDELLNADFKLFRGEIESLIYRITRDEYTKMKNQIENDMTKIIKDKLDEIDEKNKNYLCSIQNSNNNTLVAMKEDVDDLFSKFMSKVQMRIKKQNEDIAFIKRFFIESSCKLVIETDKIIKTLDINVNKYSFNDTVIICVDSFKIDNVNSVKKFIINIATGKCEEHKTVININGKSYDVIYTMTKDKITFIIDDFVEKENNYFISNFAISYKK